MKYLNGRYAFPECPLKKIRQCIAGRAVHIPALSQKRPLGETCRHGRCLLERNRVIRAKFNAGAAIEALAGEYRLSSKAIRKIVSAKEKEAILEYRGTLTSAYRFANNRMLEEWVHAYLLSDGHNEEFSQGLKLLKRYFIGPIKLPLSFLSRCCGPEENMKYRADPDWFYAHVREMENVIQKEYDMPPLIVHFMISDDSKDGVFELNDGNHRLEAYKRLGVGEYYVVVWTTERREYKKFVRRFRQYIVFAV